MTQSEASTGTEQLNNESLMDLMFSLMLIILML